MLRRARLRIRQAPCHTRCRCFWPQLQHFVTTFQCSVIQGNDTAMTFGAYSQTSVFIDVYCLVLHYLRTVSAYIIHFWVALLDHFSSLFIWNAATVRQSRCTWLSPPWVQELLVILIDVSGLILYPYHGRNMCCDCNVSEDTYGSFLFNFEIYSESQTKIWLQVLPNLPLQHVTVAASQAVMHIELFLPSSLPLCESANEEILWATWYHGILWGVATMRCRIGPSCWCHTRS